MATVLKVPPTKMAAPLPFTLSKQTVLTPLDENLIQQQHTNALDTRKAAELNPAILAMVQFLTEKAKEINLAEKLKAAAATAAKQKIEVVLWTFTTTRLKPGFDYWDQVEEEHFTGRGYEIVERLFVSDLMNRHETTVAQALWHSPLLDQVPVELHGTPLRKMMNPGVNCLGLLSHLLGEKVSVVTRDSLPSNSYDTFEAYKRDIVVKFFPGGIPLGDKQSRMRAAERWGL